MNSRRRVNSDVMRLFFSMRNVIYISVLFAVLFVSSRTAVACRCGMPTVEWAYNNSRIVFSGTVVAIESDGVIFTVDQLWKGEAPARIKVYVRNLVTSCDPGVAVGRTMLVYAYPGDSRVPLEAAYCRRTRVLTKRDPETSELDKLRSSAQEGLLLLSKAIEPSQVSAQRFSALPVDVEVPLAPTRAA